MTLEDLLAQFKAGFRERLHAPLPRPEGDEAIRAGIRAVVEALRDELTSVSRLRDVQRVFEEILASDGGSMGPSEVGGRAAVAEAPARPGDTRPVGSTIPAADPIRDAVARARGRTLAVDDIPTLNKIAAAMRTPAAAPDDVCEWTQEGWEYRRTGCDGRSYHIYNPKYGRPGNKCPECKRPVHLKSEAAR